MGLLLAFAGLYLGVEVPREKKVYGLVNCVFKKASVKEQVQKQGINVWYSGTQLHQSSTWDLGHQALAPRLHPCHSLEGDVPTCLSEDEAIAGCRV